MSRLPLSLEFLRPIVHKIRKVIKTLLGITTIEYDPNDALKKNILRVADRLTLIESQINWRLYGLPAPMTNIKLEQAQILAGSGEVEENLKLLSNHFCQKFEPSYLNSSDIKTLSIINDTSLDFIQKHYSSKEASLILETSDLFLEKPLNIKELIPLKAASLPAFLQTQSWDHIWLSSLMERITPLQTSLLIQNSYTHLNPQGRCEGIFYDAQNMVDFWNDPRRIRPMTTASFTALCEALSIPTPKFKPLDYGLIHFTLQK
jgi:hypothetical protein